MEIWFSFDICATRTTHLFRSFQASLNRILANQYNLTWLDPPGLNNKLGFEADHLHQDSNGLQFMLFNNQQVQRSFTFLNCSEIPTPWIISPNSAKRYESKIIFFYHYRACFGPKTVKVIEKMKAQLDFEIKKHEK